MALENQQWQNAAHSLNIQPTGQFHMHACQPLTCGAHNINARCQFGIACIDRSSHGVPRAVLLTCGLHQSGTSLETRHSKQTAIRRPTRCNGAAVGVGAGPAAGQVLTGQDFVFDSYDEEVFEPSHDLRELAAAQLRSMFQVLARVSPGHSSSCRACVYARRAESLGSPQISLQRVACWPPRIPQPSTAWSAGGPTAAQAPGSSSSYDEMDDLLTLHRPTWEPGSSSSGCDTEASLCQEEVVLLPNSNMLVLPLAEAGVLVGLLVVEAAGSINSRPPSPADTTNPSSTNPSSSISSTGSPWEGPGSTGGLSDDALWCLRMAVPPLAKACAMDLRTALAGAQQEAQQRLARSLLLEARGPLKVLGTFGQMLAPRLRAERSGQPESDMADGMVMQGQRLADVVAQLEAALCPVASTGGRAGARQQLALPAAAAAAAVAGGDEQDFADGFAVHDDCEVEQQQQRRQLQQQMLLPAAQPKEMKGLPSGEGAAKAGYLPERSSSTVSSSAASADTALWQVSDSPQQQQQQQQQAVVHLPGQWTAGSLESSRRNIRWSSVQPDSPVTLSHPSASTSSASSSTSNSSDKACSAFYSAATTAGGEFDMQRTIDLEPMREDGLTPIYRDSRPVTVVAAPDWSRTASSAGGSSMSTSSSKRLPRAAPVVVANSSSSKPSRLQHSSEQGVQAAVQQGHCNLIDALSHLLTAAANLAKVQGVNFIVNDPLQLDQPTGTGATASGSSTAPAGAAAAGYGSAEGGHVLLPRPLRPLLVGLAAGTCRRVLGYVLDVAMQCTPRGGQLCVSARQSCGGVEVSLLHTGQVQPGRLHTTSKAFAAAVHSGGSPQQHTSGSVTPPRISSSSGSGGVPGAVASSSSSSRSKQRSRGMQELASGAALKTSSSLVSLDFATQILQNIGGRLSVVYPCHFMNAISGQLEVGSSIEVWLPPPAPGSA